MNQIELQVLDYAHFSHDAKDAEAIIFLHFGGRNLMMWEQVLPYFNDKYRLILVDLRGHGKSDVPATGYHIDQMASDVNGVIEHLNVQKAHIVGSSLDAEVALSLAANYAEKVSSLVLEGALYSENGPYGIWQGNDSGFEQYVEGILEQTRNTPDATYSSLDATYSSLDTLVANGLNHFQDAGPALVKALEPVVIYGAYQQNNGNYANIWGKVSSEAYASHYFNYRFEEYYKKVNCPLLMLPDDESFNDERMSSIMKKFSDLTPHGQILEVKGWQHASGW